jgi:hypothetical protein
MKPAMARLTLARKIAAIVLKIWKTIQDVICRGNRLMARWASSMTGPPAAALNFRQAVSRGNARSNNKNQKDVRIVNPKPHERKPFTETEKSGIVAACDTFGRADYQHRRARAMIALVPGAGIEKAKRKKSS